MSASQSLSYWGEYGLQAVIPTTTSAANPKYVRSVILNEEATPSPDPQTQYRARFYIRPSGVTMGASDILDMFDGYNAGTVVFKACPEPKP